MKIMAGVETGESGDFIVFACARNGEETTAHEELVARQWRRGARHGVGDEADGQPHQSVRGRERRQEQADARKPGWDGLLRHEVAREKAVG